MDGEFAAQLDLTDPFAVVGQSLQFRPPGGAPSAFSTGSFAFLNWLGCLQLAQNGVHGAAWNSFLEIAINDFRLFASWIIYKEIFDSFSKRFSFGHS